MSAKKVKNIDDLVEALASQFDRLVAAEITAEEAEASSKLAASMMASCKVQMEYQRSMGTTVKIDFLESTPKQLDAGNDPE